jgi:hypothetical protein
MRIDLYGLTFDAAATYFFVGPAWECPYGAVKLFDAVAAVPQVRLEQLDDGGRRAHVPNPKVWKAARAAAERVLKGWQEEAEPGGPRRLWHWVLEAETDAAGNDGDGDPAYWLGYVRLREDESGVGEDEHGEERDLHRFGVYILPDREKG